MFTVSGENTVKCLVGFSWKKILSVRYKKIYVSHVKLARKIKSKIFRHALENLQQSSDIFESVLQFLGIFGSVQKCSEIIGNRRIKAANSMKY